MKHRKSKRAATCFYFISTIMWPEHPECCCYPFNNRHTPPPRHQCWLANAFCLVGTGNIQHSFWLCRGYEYLSAPALMKCAGKLTPGWVDMQIFTLSGVHCNDVCSSSVPEYFSICLYLRGTWTLFSQCWVWREMEERDIKKKQPLKRCRWSSCQFLFGAVHSQHRWKKDGLLFSSAATKD